MRFQVGDSFKGWKITRVVYANEYRELYTGSLGFIVLTASSRQDNQDEGRPIGHYPKGGDQPYLPFGFLFGRGYCRQHTSLVDVPRFAP